MSDAAVFDRRAVRRHRDRAAGLLARVRPVLDETAARLVERLDDTTRRFTRALDVGGRGAVAPLLRARGIDVVCCDLSERMARHAAPRAVVADEEALPFGPDSFDLVIANLSLHWVNDLPGALIQLRRAMAPEGLLLASLPALGTLASLRTALTEAEAALCGGASPRVSPFADLRDCASLLQRAGFVLPVADVEEIRLDYADAFGLVRDLRAAGETNAVSLRDKRIPPREVFARAFAALASGGVPMSGVPVGWERVGWERAGGERAGGIPVTLRFAVMTGWAP